MSIGKTNYYLRMDNYLAFSSLEDSYGGQLPPDYVKLFYYDICFDKETDYHHFYVWNQEVKDYLKNHNAIIEPKNEKDMPTSVNENEIFITFAKKDNKNEAVALFRHLRNAFSHFSIGYDGRFICLKDHYIPNKNKPKEIVITMIGKIDWVIFKGLMDIFFRQKNLIEDKMNEHLHYEF